MHTFTTTTQPTATQGFPDDVFTGGGETAVTGEGFGWDEGPQGETGFPDDVFSGGDVADVADVADTETPAQDAGANTDLFDGLG